MSAKTDKFLAGIKSGALSLWEKFGILPSVAAGQAALESAWGGSGLATKYNNLFGIKGSYQGNSAMMNTWEVYGGKRYDISDGFRAYPDQATSILDYGVFLTVNKRYAKAIGLKDYKDQIKAIHSAGYATDPDYSTKVITVIEKYGLSAWDKEVLKENKTVVSAAKTYKLTSAKSAYVSATDAISEKSKKGTVKAGTYYVFNESKGMINLTSKQGIAGSWINPTEDDPDYYVIKSGDNLTQIAKKYKTSVAAIKALNPSIKNINLIYANQKIRVK